MTQLDSRLPCGACLAFIYSVLAGCATSPPETPGTVVIPVECQQLVPDRPNMPTEQIRQRPTIDQWIQAALAEIERREAYEIKLRAALVACTTPLDPPPTGATP